MDEKLEKPAPATPANEPLRAPPDNPRREKLRKLRLRRGLGQRTRYGETKEQAIAAGRMPVQRRNYFDAKRMALYCELVATFGEQKASHAHTVGVHPNTVYVAEKRDPEFAAALAVAREAFRDSLVDEMHRRAIDGVEKPVFQQGRLVGTVREYDSTLLVKQINRHAPEYRDKVEQDVRMLQVMASAEGELGQLLADMTEGERRTVRAVLEAVAVRKGQLANPDGAAARGAAQGQLGSPQGEPPKGQLAPEGAASELGQPSSRGSPGGAALEGAAAEGQPGLGQPGQPEPGGAAAEGQPGLGQPGQPEPGGAAAEGEPA